MRAGFNIVKGDTNQAKDCIARAMTLGVKTSREYVNLGGIYALLGEKDKAIEALKKGLEMDYYDLYFPLILPLQYLTEYLVLFGDYQTQKTPTSLFGYLHH